MPKILNPNTFTLINPQNANLAFKIFAFEGNSHFDHIQRLNYYSIIWLQKGSGTEKVAFSENEQHEIKTALKEKGIVLDHRWLDKNVHLANWRSILFSGAMVSAVVLEDEKTVNELLPEFELCQNTLH